ncbi:hypothetical protein Hanom_Chr09g00807891 [Helianthus anomalus]
MRKKKKDPPPKVHNTRSVRKEEATEIKEQVESWWDKLISGEAVKKDDGSSDLIKQKADMENCVLSKSVSTVPTVSTCSVSSEKMLYSELDTSGKMGGSDVESSGSSFTVHGEESVNSSPSIMGRPDEDAMKPIKTASVYQVLGYNNRNIPIPASPTNLTPVTGSILGKSEYENRMGKLWRNHCVEMLWISVMLTSQQGMSEN